MRVAAAVLDAVEVEVEQEVCSLQRQQLRRSLTASSLEVEGPVVFRLTRKTRTGRVARVATVRRFLSFRPAAVVGHRMATSLLGLRWAMVARGEAQAQEQG